LPQNSNSKGKGDYWPLNKRHAKHKLMGSEEKSEGEWDGLSVGRQGNGGGPQSGEEIEKDWTPSLVDNDLRLYCHLQILISFPVLRKTI
jgi:hypothetical protein